MGIATQEVRQRAIEAYRSGKGTQQQIADMFGIGLRTFARWWEQFQHHGQLDSQATWAQSAGAQRKGNASTGSAHPETAGLDACTDARRIGQELQPGGHPLRNNSFVLAI